MTPTDVAVLRGAALPTLAASAVVWAVAALVAGGKGLLGAFLGTVVVFAFCGVGLWVIMRVRHRHAYSLMNAAMLTYLIKILILAALLVVLKDTTLFSTKAFGWSILVGVLVWTAAETRAFGRLQILYVDPDGTPSDPAPAAESARRETP